MHGAAYSIQAQELKLRDGQSWQTIRYGHRGVGEWESGTGGVGCLSRCVRDIK